MTLTVTSYGVKLRRFGACIQIEGKGDVQRVPAEEVSSILLTVPCSLSSEVISLCMERDIPITMLDHHGTPLWRTEWLRGGRAPMIRRRQLLFPDTANGVEFVKELLREKNAARIRFLKKLAMNRRNETGEMLKKSCLQIEAQMSAIDTVKSDSVSAVRQTLLGHEGMAGRLYFHALTRALPEKAGFSVRGRGAKAGAFNQLLNYGYGFLYRELYDFCVQAGLDPYIGLFHTEAYNRPVLVYDLIEPFRVAVEEAVCKLFSRKKICQESVLEPCPEGLRLNAEGKRILVTALEEILERKDGLYSPRQRMRELVCGLATELKKPNTACA